MSAALEIIRLGYMVWWRQIKQMLRYKANFAFGLINTVVWSVAMLLMVPFYAGSGIGSTIGTQNFLSFLLLGFAFQMYQSVALWSASGALQGELSLGIVDYVFSSPVSRYWYIVSISIANAVNETLFFIPMFTVALLFTNFTFSVLDLLFSLLAIALTVGVLIQLGVFFSTITLQFKQVSSIFGFLNLGFQMLTGMFIPIQVLPDFLRSFTLIFPQTFGIDLARHFILHTSPAFPILFQWATLILELLILGLVSAIALRYVERTAKREGLHFV